MGLLGFGVLVASSFDPRRQSSSRMGRLLKYRGRRVRFIQYENLIARIRGVERTGTKSPFRRNNGVLRVL